MQGTISLLGDTALEGKIPVVAVLLLPSLVSPGPGWLCPLGL